jgi:di/tricarboxylate transporter
LPTRAARSIWRRADGPRGRDLRRRVVDDRDRAGSPTKVALLGAAAVVLTHTVDQQEAIAADFNTLGLLAGMMLMVRLTEPTGVYNYLAIRAGELSRGRRSP